jgi:hypothetical protein
MNEKIYNVNDQLPYGKFKVRDVDGIIYHVEKDSETVTFFKDSNYSIRHRISGPAMITTYEVEVYYEWYQNDMLHRLDGPAVDETASGWSGIERWYVDDVHLASVINGVFQGTKTLQQRLDKLR